MKVLFITNLYVEYNRAGGQTMMHEMAKKAGEENDVTVLSTRSQGSPPNSIVDGVTVRYDLDVESVIYTIQPDVVVTQFEDTLRVTDLCRKNNIPLAVIVHNDNRRTLALMHAMRKTDLLIFNTEWIEKKSTYHCDSIIVHPPVDKSHFTFTKGKREYITLVNVAKPKGSDMFYHLAKKFPKYKFLGVEGGYWKDLQIASDLPNVKLIKQTDNMKDDVYAKSKIVIMPSSYESFGMVAAEAMACGVPVVVSDTPGLIENVGDGGFIIPTNMLSMWEKVIDTLMQDKDIYEASCHQALNQSGIINTDEELNVFVNKLKEMTHANISKRK